MEAQAKTKAEPKAEAKDEIGNEIKTEPTKIYNTAEKALVCIIRKTCGDTTIQTVVKYVPRRQKY